jgi:hypothetical protein
LNLVLSLCDPLKGLGLLDCVNAQASHDSANLDQLPGALFPALCLHLLGQEAFLGLQLPDPCLGIRHALLQ